jgi:peptidoglycan LD-endopeptidase LytH
VHVLLSRLRRPAVLVRLGVVLGLVSAVGFPAGLAVGASFRSAGRGLDASAPVPALARWPAHLTDALWELRRRGLAFPVDGGRAERLLDSFEQPRSGGRRHQALDIPAPRRTPVRAVDDGTVRLSRSAAGGLSVYHRDLEGRYGYFYAHLDGYAAGLKDGQRVARGDLIGYVGTTGNARGRAPHLHFSIRRLDDNGGDWSGDVLNPYQVLRTDAFQRTVTDTSTGADPLRHQPAVREQ